MRSSRALTRIKNQFARAHLEDFASGMQWYTYLLTAWSCPR